MNQFAARWVNYTAALAIFALSVWRAATLSFTIDEATTYVSYVQHGWNGIFHGLFDANNHILYSILEKFSRQWFGLSELSLRLPSLLGAALLLWSTARLCARLIPGVWFSLIGFLLVTANPLTLDFMVAARGYGLALGLLAFALLQWIEWLNEQTASGRRIFISSVALGLSVAANLMFVFAAIATFSVGCLFLLRRQRFALMPAAVIPAVVVAVALWWAPFEAYNPAVFYFGTTSIFDSVESIELATFVKDISRGDPFENWNTLFYLRYWVLPYLVPALWCGVFFWIRRLSTEALALATLVFATACFGVWLAHGWLKVLYPQERTGLSFVFIFLLTWSAAIGVCWNTNRITRWVLAFPSLLLALVFLAQFAGQSDPRYFGAWQVNWKMRDIMTELRDRQGHAEHRLRTHWIYQSTAEYYRLRWKMRYGPIVREPDQFKLDNADYFLVPFSTREQAAATGLRILYRDEATGTTLLEK